MSRLAACYFHSAAIDLPEQIGRTACDEVDDIRLQRAIGGEGGGLADRLLGPVGIAAAQLGKTADEGDGIVRDLCRHGILRLRFRLGLTVAVPAVFAGLVRGGVRQAR